MLKVNPNEVLNNNKVINNNIESITNYITVLNSMYSSLDSKVRQKKSIDTSFLDKMVSSEMKKKIFFLTNTVNELCNAMNESMDQLIEHNYSEKYYEEKIFNHLNNKGFYWDKSNMDNTSLSLFLGTDEESIRRYRIMSDILFTNKINFFSKFDFNRFGLNEYDVLCELAYIQDKKGMEEMNNIINALLYNCPDNFNEFNFNPSEQMRDDSCYNYDPNTIGNYETNSEIIEINGVEFEFAQVLPKDCTSIERLVYDFCKANVINTMRTLPNEYLSPETLDEDSAKYWPSRDIIVLTCDTDAIGKVKNEEEKAQWTGYLNDAYGSESGGLLCLDAHKSIEFSGTKYQDFLTRDSVIHELGHRYAALTNNYVSFQKKWQELANLYNRMVLELLLPGGYNSDDYLNVDEFFADAMAAYFIKGDELKRTCPELYEELTNLLGEDYGNDYTDYIEDVLNGNAKGTAYKEQHPEPQPGPEPSV